MPSPSDDMKAVLDRLPESAWTPFEWTAEYVRSYATIDLGGKQVEVHRTKAIDDDELLQKVNSEQFKASETQRWNDGRIVARVPLNKWFADLAAKVKEGDHDHMTWWLNREQNAAFRTFKGRV